MNNLPKASVIVITKDRHEDLERAINSIQELSYPKENLEVVVIEEGDNPRDIPGVKYVFLPRKNKGLGFARNTGVKNATGQILAFTDDDCIVDKNWLRNLVAAIIENNVGGACGGTLAQKGNLISRCEEVLGYPGGGIKRIIHSKGKIQKTDLLSGCNCAYKKEVFDSFSFKEHSYGRLGADDYIFGKQVAEKYGAVFNPKAIVYHKGRGSLYRIVIWFYRRRINEILIRYEKLKNRLKSVFFPIHTSILLRIVFILLIFAEFRLKGLYIVFSLLLVYFVFIILGHRRELKREESGFLVAIVLPIVKLAMNTGVFIADIKFLVTGIKGLDNVLGEYNR